MTDHYVLNRRELTRLANRITAKPAWCSHIKT
jgi:hypothetical protein